MKQLREYIEHYVTLDRDAWERIASVLHEEVYRVGEFVQFQGDVSTKLVFIKKGLARGFFLDEQGKDSTLTFMYNNSENHAPGLHFAFDYSSFLEQKPSAISIEVMETLETVELAYDDMMRLQQELPAFNEFVTKVTQRAFINLHYYLLQLRTLDAQTRFDRFLEYHSSILHRIPQYHIATFLGITPQHLSRLKAAMRRKARLKRDKKS